jgi:glycerol dehydrogenase-like iron-containing ADH family enzyme
LSAIYEALETTDCDVVLVAWGRVAYAAAQQARRNLMESAHPSDLFELEERHLSEAERLASEAKNGNLVVFIGAGVSAQAGLPNWQLVISVFLMCLFFKYSSCKDW